MVPFRESNLQVHLCAAGLQMKGRSGGISFPPLNGALFLRSKKKPWTKGPGLVTALQALGNSSSFCQAEALVAASPPVAACRRLFSRRWLCGCRLLLLTCALWWLSRCRSRQRSSGRQCPDFYFASWLCCRLGLDALRIDPLGFSQVRHGILCALQCHAARLTGYRQNQQALRLSLGPVASLKPHHPTRPWSDCPRSRCLV